MTRLEKQLVENLKTIASVLKESADQAEEAAKFPAPFRAEFVLKTHLATLRDMADDIINTLPEED